MAAGTICSDFGAPKDKVWHCFHCFPIHHQLPEFTQTHVHWVGGAIQPSHPLSSLVPFSSCLQYFPASESFPMSQFFASGGQSIGVSALASVLPINIQDWFPLGWTGWVSLQSKGLKSFLQHHSSKASILQHSAFSIVQLSYPYMTTGKTTAWTFVGKVISLLFNMLSYNRGYSIFLFLFHIIYHNLLIHGKYDVIAKLCCA